MSFCRLAGLSAKDGTNVWGLVKSARELARQAAREVGTGALNAALAAARKKRAPKAVGGRLGKIYYGTQVGVSPPAFLLFVNNPAHFDDQYRRYLSGQLRNDLGFPEVPLRLLLKPSREKELGRYA